MYRFPDRIYSQVDMLDSRGMKVERKEHIQLADTCLSETLH